MNGIINHYSILCLFIYLSIWLLGFPFLGDFWKSLFLEPHHLIVVVLLLILWESLKSWLGLFTRISNFCPRMDFFYRLYWDQIGSFEHSLEIMAISRGSAKFEIHRKYTRALTPSQQYQSKSIRITFQTEQGLYWIQHIYYFIF